MVLMETVRHNKEGHVIGFDKLNIDPMSTKQRVLAELNKSDLTQQIVDTQIAVKQAVTVTPDPVKGAQVHYAPNYNQLVGAHKQALADYEAEFCRLTQVCVMYFQPRAGEVVLPPAELAKLRERFAALGPGQKLTVEGMVV